MLHFANFYKILPNFGSQNDACKLPSSLSYEWVAEWEEHYIIETKQEILFAEFLRTLPLKARGKLCCILQVSTVYCSTLAAITMALSFPHHCHMSGWLSGKKSILEKLRKTSVSEILTYFTPNGTRKAVLYFASFCKVLFNFGSHDDGCKLPSSLPHDWPAEWKEQSTIETQQKILLAKFFRTLLPRARVQVCWILQVSTIYYSTLAAIMMAVSFPHHCHMSGWLSGKNSLL